MSSDTVPRWPRIDAIVREDGSGEVTIDGTFHPISAASLEEARVEVLRRVTENAARVGRPVRASATGPEGLWNLIVHPDGTVVPEEEELAPPSSPTPQAPPASAMPSPAAEPIPGAAGQSGQPGQAGPTAAPGPAFEGTPVVGLPPRSDPGADQFEPTGTPDPLGTSSDADGFGPTATTDLPGAVDPDPLATAVEIDPDDTVRRVPTAPQAPSAPGPEAAGDVADWVRENADAVPGSTPGSVPGNLAGSVSDGMPGNGASPASGSMNAVPVNERPVNAAPANAVPVNRAPVDAVPTAGNPGSGAGLSAPTSDPVQAGEADGPRSRREARQSFLTHQQDEDPATHGFRGMLTRMGLRVGPSESERAERADERAVSQHWPGPRTISMVNGKGGAGKTPSTVLLAAVFAQFGGAGVVTWDNNQTRGTLGWRTEQGPHESTLLDLLPQTDRLRVRRPRQPTWPGTCTTRRATGSTSCGPSR
jgi:hypothetical protein